MEVTRRHSLCTLLAAALLLTAVLSAQGAPYLPQRDDQVLETLPAGSAALRGRGVQPLDYAAAIEQARHAVRLGRAQGDPRYYGYAEGILTPWWQRPDPSAELLTLRAIVQQSRHAFDAALADLQRATARDPRNAQAWLSQAMIQRVRGDYGPAQRSCLQLQGQAEPLVVTACLGSVAALQGRGAPAYRLLAATLDAAPADTDRDTRLWALGILAELALMQGDAEGAERHLRAALALDALDHSLLAAYADLLLDQGRAAAVRTLLAQQTRSDPLLLRLALAEQRLGAPELDTHRDALIARIEANRRRGDRSHLREEARAVLQLLQRPQEALALAVENWAVQREPWDARLLLEAALAAGEVQAADPVLDWLARNGIEDARLAPLAGRLAERRP